MIWILLDRGGLGLGRLLLSMRGQYVWILRMDLDSPHRRHGADVHTFESSPLKYGSTTSALTVSALRCFVLLLADRTRVL